MSRNTATQPPAHVRLRFLVLIPLVIVCALVARAHIMKVGGTYEYVLTSFPGETITEDRIKITPPDMLKITSVTMDDEGFTHIVFEAGEPGEGMCLVSTEDSGVMFQMECSPDGVVIGDGFDINGWEAVEAGLLIVLTCTGVLSASAFWSLWRRSWYGYEMVTYAGSAIFFIVTAVSILLFHLLGAITSFYNLAMVIVTMATTFVNVATLPMAALLLFVGASNAVLLRREGVGFTNLLGVVACVAFGLVLLGLWFLHTHISEIIMNPYAYIFIDSALTGIVAYAVALFLGVCLTALLAAHHVPAFPRDYLIILGSGLRKDGTPTPLLAGRIEAALGYNARQTEAGHAAATFVPSGGQGPDEVCSEAASMGRYIEEHVDRPRILLEDRSTNTHDNMAFSAEIIAGDGAAADAPVAFSTTNYHVLRGYVYAHEAGLAAEGIAAPTKLYFWPNAFLREFVGMLAARAVAVALNCVVIVALYIAAEYILLLT